MIVCDAQSLGQGYGVSDHQDCRISGLNTALHTLKMKRKLFINRSAPNRSRSNVTQIKIPRLTSQGDMKMDLVGISVFRTWQVRRKQHPGFWLGLIWTLVRALSGGTAISDDTGLGDRSIFQLKYGVCIIKYYYSSEYPRQVMDNELDAKWVLFRGWDVMRVLDIAACGKLHLFLIGQRGWKGGEVSISFLLLRLSLSSAGLLGKSYP